MLRENGLNTFSHSPNGDSFNLEETKFTIPQKCYEKKIEVFIMEKLTDGLKCRENPLFYSFKTTWYRIIEFLTIVNSKMLPFPCQEMYF